MIKPRIMDKITGKIYCNSDIDEVLAHLPEYPFVEIPEVGDFEPKEEFPYFKEKIIVIDIGTLKEEKKKINENALLNKSTIITSRGVLSLKTPIGDLSTAIMGLLLLNLPSYSNVLRTSEGQDIPDMTLDEFKDLYLEIFNKYKNIDEVHTEINRKIELATTEEELNSIIIDYSNI